jgi:hypothetical protein
VDLSTIVPPGAVELGPFGLNGSASGAGSSEAHTRFYRKAFATGGYEWSIWEGSYLLGESASLVTGLIRMPEEAGLGNDWFCPGVGAFLMPVSTEELDDDCTGNADCTFALVMPNPERVTCGVPGEGTLSMPLNVPQADEVALTTTVAALMGDAVRVGTYNVLDLSVPTRFDPHLLEMRQTDAVNMLLLFDSERVPAPGDQPTTEWTLSNLTLMSRATSRAATELYCVAQGTYQIGTTEPLTHGLELSGIATVASCPGEPVDQAVVLYFD